MCFRYYPLSGLKLRHYFLQPQPDRFIVVTSYGRLKHIKSYVQLVQLRLAIAFDHKYLLVSRTAVHLAGDKHLFA